MRAPRLLVLTDPDAPGGLVRQVERALGAGAPPDVAVQLRAKALSARALLDAAVAIRAITRAAGARFLVNGRLDVAVAAGADGVHLPEDGLPVAVVRALLPSAIVGVSCHDAAGLARAAAEGADYATLGPIRAVPGKNPPMGVTGFAAHVLGASLPVLALGGVDTPDVAALRDAGAHGVAVIRAVAAAAEPAAALRALARALDTGAGRAR